MRAMIFSLLTACGTDESPRDIVDCDMGGKCERVCVDRLSMGMETCQVHPDGRAITDCASAFKSDGVLGCCTTDASGTVTRFFECEP
ncbi:MAG TPA: hypothetical protein VG994_02700 [Steroidobacteraceae bacterium]|nr:hypothetical protein [Steroidobacteraceae bacterium]